ncbi:MAG: single-stranded-DNA-specific exonuclease RecJ [Cyanobacteria bacterium HKST-UBA04]|nr:single-stranded-DNA-specific exonuclease RecJ [Cyanobacteria bacterium HKST-UBA04]
MLQPNEPVIRLKAQQSPTPEQVQAACDSPVLAQLLLQRGLANVDDIHRFLQLDDYTPTGVEALPDWPKSLERLARAIDTQEPILIFGDFDVDGITGTTILYQCLKLQLGANVTYYIPHRHTEGHGLNTAALLKLVSSRQLKLVISTDTGITNYDEVHLLNSFGVDCIITDHHDLPESLPPALGILNPKLLDGEHPLYPLSGAGVAYKVCQALLAHYGKAELADELLDLAAIGTVVDMVPLVADNRHLVWQGLKRLGKNRRLGLKALLESAGTDMDAPITTTTLGFVIGPRLNAVGRISHASEAVELLITDSFEVAQTAAARLEQMNRQRKTMVEEAVVQATAHLTASGDLSVHKAAVVCSPAWNNGIVGLVASDLVGRFNRPAFVGTVEPEEGVIKFSARSIDGFDLHAALAPLADMFLRWGGHAGAAGFSIKQTDLAKVKEALFAVCDAKISPAQMRPVFYADMALCPDQINEGFLALQDMLEPTGMDNPSPVFVMSDVALSAARRMGSDEKHLQITVQGAQSGRYLKGVYWNWGADTPLPASSSSTPMAAMAFSVQRNTFNGKTTPQLMLKHLSANQSALPDTVPLPDIPLPAVPLPDVSASTKAAPLTRPSAPVGQVEPMAPMAPMAPAEPSDSVVTWIDHRQHPHSDGLFSQMMQACQAPSPPSRWAIYCQGSQHYLPFATLADWVWPGTDALAEAGWPEALPLELILWDLPPGPAQWQAVLAYARQAIEGAEGMPLTVHLVGGKYRHIPLVRPATTYLDGLWRLLMRCRSTRPNQPVPLGYLTHALATTPDVVWGGLACLERLDPLAGVLQVITETADVDDVGEAGEAGGAEAIRIVLPDGVAPVVFDETDSAMAALMRCPAWQQFNGALGQVHRFRQQMMTAPLSVLESVGAESHPASLCGPDAATAAVRFA